jgi:hypothetical protein
LLLTHGGNPKATDWTRTTALEWAVWSKSPQTIKALLGRGNFTDQERLDSLSVANTWEINDRELRSLLDR